MRIVAAKAIGFFKGLVLVRLLQRCIFWIVAIDAERGRRFGQMEIELSLSDFTGLMRGVTSVAAQVERGVAAAVLSGIRGSNVVAGEAEIVLLVARFRLQQLVLVVGRMRIVAGQAIANCRRMHVPLD